MTGPEPTGPFLRPLRRVGLPILLSLAAVSALKGLTGQAGSRSAGGFWGALKPSGGDLLDATGSCRYVHTMHPLQPARLVMTKWMGGGCTGSDLDGRTSRPCCRSCT